MQIPREINILNYIIYMNRSANLFKKKFTCHHCKAEIPAGEFMAVLAKAPKKEYVSSTNAVIRKWIKQTDGVTYCQTCFDNKYKK